MANSTLRPGLLVSLSARITGGVTYDRRDLDASKAAAVAGADAEVTRWETTKIIDDPAEYERAVKMRGKCRNLVSSVCASSDFGLLCPSSREFDLTRAIEEARRIAAEHNAAARRSFVEVYVITGRVAENDAEAVRAISSEVRTLIDSMKAGIDSADPASIREAARKAKGLATMLTEESAGKVTAAIEEARKVARDLVRRVEKGGEVAAKVVAESNLAALDACRVAFDIEAPAESAPLPTAPAAPVEFDPAIFEAPAAESPTLVAPAAEPPVTDAMFEL